MNLLDGNITRKPSGLTGERNDVRQQCYLKRARRSWESKLLACILNRRGEIHVIIVPSPWRRLKDLVLCPRERPLELRILSLPARAFYDTRVFRIPGSLSASVELTMLNLGRQRGFETTHSVSAPLFKGISRLKTLWIECHESWMADIVKSSRLRGEMSIISSG